MPTKIKWMIAHEPAELFLRTARAFNEEIQARTNGEYEVETLLAANRKDAMRLMPSIQSGEIQMAQVIVGKVGLNMLDLPYLFRDHAHAERVLEGDIGENLLSKLEARKGVRGLAFTYSGGYRMFCSDTPINSLEDLRAQEVATHDNEVMIETMAAMGLTATPVETTDWGNWNVDNYECQAAETTFVRYTREFQDKKHIANTEHSLFLTTIVANKDWLAALPADVREAFKAAAIVAARKEREWSLQDSAKVRDEADAFGCKIYDLTADERAELAQNTQAVYDLFPAYKKLVQQIRSI